MLTKLYGRKALVLHDGKSEYRAVSGVLQVPQSLVQRAVGAGFSRSPFLEEDVTAEALAPANDAATQTQELPALHPQTAADLEQRQPAAEKAGGKRR